MPKVKKIPQRQCVGCREMKDKKSLLRVVKSPEGEVSLDFVLQKPCSGRLMFFFIKGKLLLRFLHRKL